MSAADDVTYVAFRVRITAPDGSIAEGECLARDGGSMAEQVRRTVINLVRTGAGRWEFVSDQQR